MLRHASARAQLRAIPRARHGARLGLHLYGFIHEPQDERGRQQRQQHEQPDEPGMAFATVEEEVNKVQWSVISCQLVILVGGISMRSITSTSTDRGLCQFQPELIFECGQDGEGRSAAVNPSRAALAVGQT